MTMSEVQNRTPRESQSREKTLRPMSWSAPELLPNPNPEAGYAFRWIRTSLLGTVDPTNVSAKFREGWEPVKASDHPEVQVMSDLNSRFKDAIEIGGLILCKTPVEFVQQRDQHFQQVAASQMTSVDNNFMREGDPRMPLFKERQSKVSFGSGT
jgi:hypothetical protein